MGAFIVHMNGFLIAVGALLTIAAVTSVGAQQRSTSVCTEPDAAPQAILTICTHARGMAPWPQPRLYLRVFADGRAEYEGNPRVPEGHPGGYQGLVRREVQVTPAEVNELLCLGREPDFQAAEPEYKRVHKGIDSSLKTTVVFRDGGGREKNIVLNNYSPEREDNVEHYPSSLNALMSRAAWIWERANGIVRTVPTITFCELMREPSEYLGKRVSIHADLEHHASVTRDLKRVYINEFLHDPDCSGRPRSSLNAETAPVLTRTPEELRNIVIGIGYPSEEGAVKALKDQITKLRGEPFHGRARVLVTGVLRKPAVAPGLRYFHEFEIAELKSIEPIIVAYQGSLVNGWTYADTFDHAGGSDIKLSSPLKKRLGHVERIEWRYTGFPLLVKPGRRHVVFRVVYVTTQMIAKGRWSEIYACEVIKLK